MSRWACAVHHNKLGGGKTVMVSNFHQILRLEGSRKNVTEVSKVAGDNRPKTVPGLTTDSTCSTFSFEWVISRLLQILSYNDVPEKCQGLLNATVPTVTSEDMQKNTKITRKAASSWTRIGTRYYSHVKGEWSLACLTLQSLRVVKSVCSYSSSISISSQRHLSVLISTTKQNRM
jgi:hypothetical protein